METLGTFYRPKLNKCVYCSQPAIKQTCGSTECKQKRREAYNQRRKERLAREAEARAAGVSRL